MRGVYLQRFPALAPACLLQKGAEIVQLRAQLMQVLKVRGSASVQVIGSTRDKKGSDRGYR